MGQPKELLQLGNTTMLGRITETLLLCTFPVVVVARDTKQELPPLALDLEVVYDAVPDQGPLAGMATGMRFLHGECDAVLVTSCDMPWISEDVVHWMATQLGDHDMLIPRVDGILQPMCALYQMRILPALEQLQLSGEKSPKTLVEHVRARVLDEAAVDSFDKTRKFLRSIETPEDYERLRREVGSCA